MKLSPAVRLSQRIPHPGHSPPHHTRRIARALGGGNILKLFCGGPLQENEQGKEPAPHSAPPPAFPLQTAPDGHSTVLDPGTSSLPAGATEAGRPVALTVVSQQLV